LAIQHPLEANLGHKARLLGFDLDREVVEPGDAFVLTLYWQALREMLERLQQEEFEALLAEGYKEMAGENTAIAEESSDAQTVATKEVWR